MSIVLALEEMFTWDDGTLSVAWWVILLLFCLVLALWDGWSS